MKIPFYQIDAFTGSVFSGNPAGVCLLDAWLPDDILQSIAAENNLSETAFIIEQGDSYSERRLSTHLVSLHRERLRGGDTLMTRENVMCSRRIDFENLEWTSPDPKVRFKAFRHGGRQLRLVEFSKGFVEPDWCCRGHIGLVLEGQMLLEFDDEKILLKSGDGLFIPAGESHRHKAVVLTESVRVVLVEDV